MPLLTSAEFDAIRRKMGFPDGAARFLPDPKVEGVTETAEGWVAARTSDTGVHAVRAAIAYAAYILLPQSRGELQAAFNTVGGSQAASADGWFRHTQLLLEEAEREVGEITEVVAPEPSRHRTRSVGVESVY